MADEGNEPDTFESVGGPFEEDRRDDRRVSLGTGVTIHSPASSAELAAHSTGLSEEAELSVDGHGGDISVGGMYLVAGERLPAGSTVEVEFELPNSDERFDLPAQVRWTRRVPRSDDSTWWAVGLEFEEIEESTREILDEFVLRQLSG